MGKVVGFELNSQEHEKAAKFYSSVFGWDDSEPKWGYRDVSRSGIIGGIRKGPHDYPHGTRIQIEVESIDEAIFKAIDNGATVVREKLEFDDVFLAYLS